jgi:TolB-like protein
MIAAHERGGHEGGMGESANEGEARAGSRLSLAHAPPLGLGALHIEPSLRRVSRPDGAEQIIEPRVMQVLITLASAGGGIRSRDDLLAACWQGVVVGEDAVNRVISRVRRLLSGLGQGEFELETVPRVGYRLVRADGTGFLAASPAAALAGPPPAAPAAPAAPHAGPWVAVLPFANLSGDARDDYFADGMVEEIVTALSRLRSLQVTAPGPGMAARGESAAEAAARLGVRYALEGSVRRAAGRVRIAVRLIDLTDRGQIWAERFEDDLSDVFALQDRVALAVAAVIEPRVQHSERRRAAARPTADIGAYDLYLRALALYRAGSRESLTEALDLLDRALALDSAYGLACALAAMARRDLVLNLWSADPAADRRLALDLAGRALRAAGDDAEVLAFAAATLGALEADGAGAAALFERALTLNPGSAAAWMSSGMMRLRLGQSDLAAAHLETSLRLDPLSPLRGWQLLGLGAARFEQERWTEAAAALAEAARLLPTGPALVLLAACHARMDQPAEAREILARFAAQDAGGIDEQIGRLWNDAQRALCRAALAGLAGGAGQAADGLG